jgi:hypothetical protein
MTDQLWLNPGMLESQIEGTSSDLCQAFCSGQLLLLPIQNPFLVFLELASLCFSLY